MPAVRAAHLPASTAVEPGGIASFIADYRELFKDRVTLMVIITGWAGFYLASVKSGISSVQPGLLDALIGIGMISAGAAALNEVLERKIDQKMVRTANRPLATGRIGPLHGMIAGFGVLIVGSFWLMQTNLLTVSLALLTVLSYVAVYTPLKRVTHMATFVGAFPGAMGPLLGWTAVRSQIEWPAVALFAILFIWQFPHFMAISWLYRHDYGRAGIKMLPVVQPDGWSTVAEALFCAVVMIPVSLTPYFLHIAGRAYAVTAILLGLGYLAYTIRFGRIIHATSESESRLYARDLLKVSVVYLPLLLTALMLNATPTLPHMQP